MKGGLGLCGVPTFWQPALCPGLGSSAPSMLPTAGLAVSSFCPFPHTHPPPVLEDRFLNIHEASCVSQ